MIKKLYAENIEKIISIRKKLNTFDLEGPFLISPPLSYFDADRKLMIIGQQTNGWSCNLEDVQQQMKAYEDFNLGETYYNSPFWSFYHKLENLLKVKTDSSVWNNINKFDLEADRPTGEIEKEISRLDYLIAEEIRILKPDICIFLVGHSFDERLANIFSNIKKVPIDLWQERQVCRLSHKDLPINSFRTYHPKYLRLSKLENKVLESLKKEIS